MKKSIYFLTVMLIVSVVAGTAVCAQTSVRPNMLRVTGDISNPLELSYGSLLTMPRTEVARKDKDGKIHMYKGVLLSEILMRAGASLGKDLHGRNLAKYALIQAGDGYQVIFALPELDEAFADRKVILADRVDGAPLPTLEGPLRVIVADEKRPARCIRQVTEIRIENAR